MAQIEKIPVMYIHTSPMKKHILMKKPERLYL